MGISIDNPDAQPKDRIRKMQFLTKASCEADPIYYRIDGYAEKLSLEEVEAPTPEYSFKHTAKKGKKEPKHTQTHMPYKDAEETPF